MGVFSQIKQVLKATNGNTKLEDACQEATQLRGCYKIFHKNRLKYVGIAERSVRRTMRELYKGDIKDKDNGTKHIYENRDNVTVSWADFQSKEECKEVKEMWIKRYRPEWNMEDIEKLK